MVLSLANDLTPIASDAFRTLSSSRIRESDLWTPQVLMQMCKATYPSDMSTALSPSFPTPPPQESLQFVIPREVDALFPFICNPSKRANKQYTVHFKLLELQKDDGILQSNPKKSLFKACEELGMNHSNILK